MVARETYNLDIARLASSVGSNPTPTTTLEATYWVDEFLKAKEWHEAFWKRT